VARSGPDSRAAAQTPAKTGQGRRIPEGHGQTARRHAQGLVHTGRKSGRVSGQRVQHHPVKRIVLKRQVVISGGFHLGFGGGIDGGLFPQAGRPFGTDHVKTAFPEQRQKQTFAAVDLQKSCAPARPGCQTLLQQAHLKVQGETSRGA
jgi:hypothetical protein